MLNYKCRWKQTIKKVVETMFIEATVARKDKLVKELSDFIDDCFIDELDKLDRDEVDTHFFVYFENYGDTVIESDGNGYRDNKEYFWHQLQTCSILATELLNPSLVPVAMISKRQAKLLFRDEYYFRNGAVLV